MFEVASDGRTFIIERRGGIKLFDPLTQGVKPVGMLGVNTEVEVGNGEQGLVGMSLDPKFDENGWMYLYYFHPVEAKTIPRPLNFLLRRSFLVESECVERSLCLPTLA